MSRAKNPGGLTYGARRSLMRRGTSVCMMFNAGVACDQPAVTSIAGVLICQRCSDKIEEIRASSTRNDGHQPRRPIRRVVPSRRL